MSDTPTEVDEGDRFDTAFEHCPYCSADDLRVVETSQYTLETCTREVRCDACGTQYEENYDLVETRVLELPSQL